MAFAASVTIVDLPLGTTVTGIELLEAVQTTNGVGQSVQLSVNQSARRSRFAARSAHRWPGFHFCETSCSAPDAFETSPR